MIKKNDSEKMAHHFPNVDWEEPFWGFTCYSRQDYAGQIPLDAEDEIMLGSQYPDGGCLNEMAFRWYKMNDELVPRLEVYSEAWHLLQTHTIQMVMGQLIQEQEPMPTPDEMSALLIAWGFVDQSDRPLDIQPNNPLVI